MAEQAKEYRQQTASSRVCPTGKRILTDEGHAANDRLTSRMRNDKFEDPDVHPVIFWATTGHWPSSLFSENGFTPQHYQQDDSYKISNLYDDAKHSPGRYSSMQTRSSASKPLVEGSKLLEERAADTETQRSLSKIGRGERNTSNVYQSARYERDLARLKSFNHDHRGGLNEKSRDLVRMLISTDRTVPVGTCFDDSSFQDTCVEVRGRSEAKALREISPVLVPSPPRSRQYGPNPTISMFVDSVDECWMNSVPVLGPKPTPDFAVGLHEDAFDSKRLDVLKPLLRGSQSSSFFRATDWMIWPFFTTEVKCGSAALDVADRQNAHSTTIMARAFVELYQLIDAAEEINGDILGFSVAHNTDCVRIHGRYAVTEEGITKYYLHKIRAFDFTELGGRDRWVTWKFTQNIYEHFGPMLLQRINSVIDRLVVLQRVRTSPLCQPAVERSEEDPGEEGVARKSKRTKEQARRGRGKRGRVR